MKNIIFLLMIPFVMLAACNGKTVEEIAEKFPDGTPKTVRYYKVHGEVRDLVKEIQYYPDHQKFYEGEYKDNKKDGKWVVWYKNGNIWSEGYYKNGLDHGKRTAYHENGEKHFTGKYREGKMVGTWRFYDDTGELVKEEDYSKK